jgi:hypothetical protein
MRGSEELVGVWLVSEKRDGLLGEMSASQRLEEKIGGAEKRVGAAAVPLHLHLRIRPTLGSWHQKRVRER